MIFVESTLRNNTHRVKSNPSRVYINSSVLSSIHSREGVSQHKQYSVPSLVHSKAANLRIGYSMSPLKVHLVAMLS